MSKLNDFIPINSDLASAIGLTQAAVAGAVWKFSQLRRGVCDASAATIGKAIGLERTTVSKSLRALTANGWIIDTTPDAGNRTHKYLPGDDLINILCKSEGCGESKTDDLITSSEDVIINQDESDDLITSTDDLIPQVESLKNIKPTTTTTAGAHEAEPKNNNAETAKAINTLFGENFGDVYGKHETAKANRAAILAAVKVFSSEWVLRAMRLALSPERANGQPKSWGYVVAILEGWHASGGPDADQKPANRSKNVARDREKRATGRTVKTGAEKLAKEPYYNPKTNEYIIPGGGTISEAEYYSRYAN